jgi:hypothetical protein
MFSAAATARRGSSALSGSSIRATRIPFHALSTFFVAKPARPSRTVILLRGRPAFSSMPPGDIQPWRDSGEMRKMVDSQPPS